MSDTSIALVVVMINLSAIDTFKTAYAQHATADDPTPRGGSATVGSMLASQEPNAAPASATFHIARLAETSIPIDALLSTCKSIQCVPWLWW